MPIYSSIEILFILHLASIKGQSKKSPLKVVIIKGLVYKIISKNFKMVSFSSFSLKTYYYDFKHKKYF